MYKEKPKGSRQGQTLSKREQRRIVKLAQVGELNFGEIGRMFGVVPQTIARICKRHGVTRWRELTPELEAEAVHLLLDGIGPHRVAKQLRISSTVTAHLMQKHGIVHRGGGKHYSVEQQLKLTEKLEARDKFIVQIAREEGLDLDTVRKFAHTLLGPARFSGVRPLEQITSCEEHSKQSYDKFLEELVNQIFSTDAGRTKAQKILIDFVRKELQIFHNGVVPADREAFLQTLLDAYLSAAPFTHEHLKEVRGYLACAIEAVAPSAPQWTN